MIPQEYLLDLKPDFDFYHSLDEMNMHPDRLTHPLRRLRRQAGHVVECIGGETPVLTFTEGSKFNFSPILYVDCLGSSSDKQTERQTHTDSI